MGFGDVFTKMGFGGMSLDLNEMLSSVPIEHEIFKTDGMWWHHS